MGPSFIAFPDGRYLLAHDEASARRRRGGQVLQPRRRPPRRLRGVAARAWPTCSRRCCCAPRPASGRAGPATCSTSCAWRGGCAGLDVRGHGRRHPAVHDVDRRRARRVVRVARGQGRAGDQRRHRHVGRPGGAGHRLRDDAPHDRRRRRRPPRVVGLPDRRDGRRVRRDPPRRPSRSAPRSAPAPRSSASDVADGQVHRRRHPGRHASSGAASSSPPPTPRSRSCASSTAAELPDDFVNDLEQWRIRSGTVKVNVALSELPDFLAWPGTSPHERFTGSVELCHSIDYLQQAFQDARGGPGRGPPVLRRRHPVDRSTRRCAPRARTSCRCSPSGCPTTWSDEPHPPSWRRTPTGSSTATPSWRPNFKQSVIHRQVIGP